MPNGLPIHEFRLDVFKNMALPSERHHGLCK